MPQSEDFEREAKEAAGRMLDAFIAMTGERPERGKCLYHYTDAQGLLGILQTNTLRGTDARFMNDPLELSHGFRVITDYCDAELGTRYPVTSELLKEALRLNKLFGVKTAYLASLSEEGDLLSQWRAYAADGAGYSIGIDPYQSLVALPRKPELEGIYIRVRYGEDEQRALFEQVVTPIAEVIERYGKAFFERDRGPAFRLLDNPVSLVAAAMKQKGFHEEREWRIVMPWMIRGFDVHFRPSSRGVIPYVKFSPYREPHLSVRDVVCGPRLGEAALNAVEMALNAHGHDNVLVPLPGAKGGIHPGFVRVRRSEIQYG